ncbi:MAG: type 1 glutamine amidotransferase [Acidimicrobiales bacterium]
MPPAPDGRPWVVVQHTPTEGPGLLAGVLEEAAVPMAVIRLDRGDRLPPPTDAAAVVVMGGPMGVHDTAGFPWLGPERHWLAYAVEQGTPVLGVCLGAQLLAAALGATVSRGPAPEIGVGAVTLNDEGRADPVLGPEGDALPVVHWHGDTFTIPAGATHLASSDRYPNQAFRYGTDVYGLQFHLEVDDEVADAWRADLPAGVSLDGPSRVPVEAAGRRVFGRFVGLVRAAVTGR